MDVQCFSDGATDRTRLRTLKAKINIDTERLITEVRFLPAIWDLSSVFYKDRDAKLSAWQEVCEELIPDFDGKSDSEKKDIRQ